MRTDHLTGDRILKIELNIFDRDFFRDFVQSFPKVAGTTPLKKSHELIKNAYEFFKQKIDGVWDRAGGGKKGFDQASHITRTLLNHMVLVTVVSNNEQNAASIFATLNDRGIGLSTVDLIRSFVLQHAPATQREEIIQCWDAMFNSCGTTLAAEALIRMSWVAQHGDVKTRALYKVVSEALKVDNPPVEYSRRLRGDAALYGQLRAGDTDDSDLREYLIALRDLKFNACYPLLLAADQLDAEEKKTLTKAIVALFVRHNVVCDLDRAKLESTVYAAAKLLSKGEGHAVGLATLQAISPAKEQFDGSFANLAFSTAKHSTARYLLTCFDARLATTTEVTIAGAERVHVEHIYPQKPPSSHRWKDHERQVFRLGNLTLLDKRLNEQIKTRIFRPRRTKIRVWKLRKPY